MTLRERINGILRCATRPMTSREIWQKLPAGTNFNSVSGQLCKWALYGQLDREEVRVPGAVPNLWYVYSIKEVARVDNRST